MRSISKSTENLKQIFSFLQPHSQNGNNHHRNSTYPYHQEDEQYENSGIGMNSSGPSSRSISYESNMINPWRTENSMLKSLLQRIITDLNIDTTSEYHSVLNSSDRFLSIDMMLELQTQVLSSIQKLKQKSSPFTTSNHFRIDDDDDDDRDARGERRESDLEKDDLPNLFSFEWRNCLEVHAPPPFDLDSPVVQHIFDTWTTDENKINFLKNWILNLSTKKYDAVPIGIQITNISQVLRDAFIMLIVPIMRRRSIDPLEVMLRERFLHSLPPIDAEFFPSTTASAQTNTRTTVRLEKKKKASSPTSPSLNADPFVTPEHSVFDIRIKRVVPHVDVSPLSPTVSSSAHSKNSPSTPGIKNNTSLPRFDQFHEIDSHSPSIPQTNKIIGPSKAPSVNALSPHRISSQRNPIHHLEELPTAVMDLQENNLEEVYRNNHFHSKENPSHKAIVVMEDDEESVHSKEEFPISDLFASLHLQQQQSGEGRKGFNK